LKFGSAMDHSRLWKLIPLACLWFPISVFPVLYFVSKMHCFFRYSPLKSTVTLKSGFRFTQGHWKWHRSIDCIITSYSCSSNVGTRLYRFWYIAWYSCKFAIFSNPSLFRLFPCVELLTNFQTTVCLLKLQSLDYVGLKTAWSCRSLYLNNTTTWRTDERTVKAILINKKA